MSRFHQIQEKDRPGKGVDPNSGTHWCTVGDGNFDNSNRGQIPNNAAASRG